MSRLQYHPLQQEFYLFFTIGIKVKVVVSSIMTSSFKPSATIASTPAFCAFNANKKLLDTWHYGNIFFKYGVRF
jgi:hypothetical protein